jgi:hypothetical protein
MIDVAEECHTLVIDATRPIAEMEHVKWSAWVGSAISKHGTNAAVGPVVFVEKSEQKKKMPSRGFRW